MAKPKVNEIVPATTGEIVRLHDLLMKEDKKGLFKASSMSLGYPSGFLPLDFRNGYLVKSYDDNDNLITTYKNVGFFGGTANMIIGKSGVAKTTFVCQTSANIFRMFQTMYGKPIDIFHFDAEQASNYTRIKKVTNLSTSDLKNHYHLYQDTFIEDIFTQIVRIAQMKERYKDVFSYDSGVMDEFCQPITTYVPTIIFIDSIPSLATKDMENKDEMAGSMYAGRVAKELSRFYKTMMPVLKKYNFILFAVNHINQKIEINPMMKTQPQLLYLKMDESVPGGMAPLYYSHNVLKFVTNGKYNEEDDGFDGFLARCELLKSRSNKAGKTAYLVYDQDIGFDQYRTLHHYCKDNDLVQGRNPYQYFEGYQDLKFDGRKFSEIIREDKKLMQACYDVTYPSLDKMLSNIKFNDPNQFIDIGVLCNSLAESYSAE